MKTIHIRVPITECDIQDFEAVAYAKDDSEDFNWSFEAEDADINVVVHFYKEEEEDEQ